MFDKCVALLKSRGVEILDIAECVIFLQRKHHPEVTIDQVIPIIEGILHKREVQHAILTGISLDIGAEQELFDKDLCDILNEDYSLYGIDEVLAYGICNLYGSIALTNYGYIDREKPGIIGRLNEHDTAQCNCFLDDIVGAIAASAASKIAHSNQPEVKP